MTSPSRYDDMAPGLVSERYSLLYYAQSSFSQTKVNLLLSKAAQLVTLYREMWGAMTIYGSARELASRRLACYDAHMDVCPLARPMEMRDP